PLCALLSRSIRPPPSPPLLPYTTLFRSAFAPPAVTASAIAAAIASHHARSIAASAASSCTRSGASTERMQISLELGMRSVDAPLDRKSTRLNSSHQIISYAVFCLKKKQH